MNFTYQSTEIKPSANARGRERGHALHIDARIARLAILSASAAALFLIETWKFKHPDVELKKDFSDANLPENVSQLLTHGNCSNS